MPHDASGLEMFIVQPPAQEATLHGNSTHITIHNASGLTVRDIGDEIRRYRFSGAHLWRVQVKDAVFAPASIIKKVREEGFFQVQVKVGELIDDSNTRLEPFQNLGLRAMVLKYLAPACMMRLRQASKATLEVAKSDVAQKAAFYQQEIPAQYWVFDMHNAAEPVYARLTAHLTTAAKFDHLKRLWDILDINDPGRQRWRMKPVAVVNDAVFALPEDNLIKQVRDGHVELLISVPTSTIHANSSCQKMLMTDPSPERSFVCGSLFNLGLRLGRDTTVKDVLTGGQEVEKVIVCDTVVVKRAIWDKMQSVWEITPEHIYALWKDCMHLYL